MPEKMTEMQELELEEARYRLEQLREASADRLAKKETREQALRMQAQTERKNREQIENEQKRCSHKKGGRGLAGLFTGNAAEYSVITHTEPWGETYVKCQRCGKEFRDPWYMMRKLNLDKLRNFVKVKKNRIAYNETMKAYRAALEWPTDNSPSGGAIFSIEKGLNLDLEDEADELAA